MSFLFRYQIIAIFHDFPDLLWQIGWTSQEKAGKSWYPLAVASRKFHLVPMQHQE
jgi:hypothetical protein